MLFFVLVGAGAGRRGGKPRRTRGQEGRVLQPDEHTGPILLHHRGLTLIVSLVGGLADWSVGSLVEYSIGQLVDKLVDCLVD